MATETQVLIQTKNRYFRDVLKVYYETLSDTERSEMGKTVEYNSIPYCKDPNQVYLLISWMTGRNQGQVFNEVMRECGDAEDAMIPALTVALRYAKKRLGVK